jgi:4'-phosphopantetheinyl transferase
VNANVGRGLRIGSLALRLDKDNTGKISAPWSSVGPLAQSNSCAGMIKHALDCKTNTPPDDDSISIWSVGLEWPESEVQAAAEILSSEEQERAKRFHRVRDRKHFIVAHAVLRLILGRYLNIDPRQVSSENNTFGKPRLMDGAYYPDVRFNVAHSRSVALYAFAIGREIGVDLEFTEPDFARMGLARTLFAPEEVEALSPLSNKDFVAGFYRCWTRKEAYVKAKGLGLSLPLNSFVVSVGPPNETPLLIADRNEIGEQTEWILVDLIVGEGFAASLAVECRP